MSLATRCTTCGTVFRVVQTQLKASEGWVRCGRCDDVFNAMEGLFDLQKDAPPAWTAPSDPIAVAYQTSLPPPSDGNDLFQLSDEDRIHSRFFHPEQDDVEYTPAEALDEQDRVDFVDAQMFTDIDTDIEDIVAGTAALRTPSQEAPTQVRHRFSRTSAPEFLRTAWRKAQWQTPDMRRALVGTTLALACLLALQATFHFRDIIAARWSGLRPLLAGACVPMHCRLELPRHIDSISVESSSLSPAQEGAAYKLAVVLRNRDTLALAMPSIELSLTDSQGELVSRRALSSIDFHVDRAELAAGAETSLQLLMSTGGRRVNGYTVEIFYP